MPQRFSIAIPAPEHANDLAGWIGAEPTGEAEAKQEEGGGWFDWLPGFATGVTDFLKSEGGQEVIKTGATLYLTKEQREAAEKAAREKESRNTMEQLLKLTQSRPSPITSPTLPSQPTIIMQQPTGGKTNWVVPVAIGVGALVLLGGGFFLLKGKTKTRRRR